MNFTSIIVGIIIVAFFAVLCYYFWILILLPASKKAKSLEKGQGSGKVESKKQNNKFCNSCGAVVEKDYKFCCECGKQLK